MASKTEGKALGRFIRQMPGFLFVDAAERYSHIGATIVDAVLQAGLSYDTVVKPRVDRIRVEFAAFDTTSRFLQLLDLVGPAPLLNWRHPEKPRRVVDLARFCKGVSVESEPDLALYLGERENEAKLLSIRGIGEKTIDYLKNLVGLSTVAVDRHVRNFVALAGITANSYAEVRHAVINAAHWLRLPPATLDYSIWTFMSAFSHQCRRRPNARVA